MERKHAVGLMLSLFIFNTGFLQTEKIIELKLFNAREIGRENLMFASIASVCEDDEANFYVLDRIEHKVYKFSPDGKLELSFGNKGQGPGEFQQPNGIFFTPRGHLAVASDLNDVSFLNRDGTFIKRNHFSGRLALGYIGEERYYAWIWRQEDRQQVMLDRDNNIIKTLFSVDRDLFSVSIPDESGRGVMFNYSPDEYAPTFQFANFGKYSAVAVSNKYEILILNGKGETISTIRHDATQDPISKKEKNYFAREIDNIRRQRGWPKSVISKILKKIPAKKNFFDRVLLSGQYVFVFRIKEDITLKKAALLVDIFTIKGDFLGAAQLMDKPIFISDKYMYFVQYDEEHNQFLVVKDYQINGE